MMPSTARSSNLSGMLRVPTWCQGAREGVEEKWKGDDRSRETGKEAGESVQGVEVDLGCEGFEL
jgi:hypothetical protein